MNKLTVEELDYLIRRLTFTYKNCTIPKMKNMCESILDKLEKEKGKRR